MPELDLFILFRTLLFIFLTIYSILLMVSGLWQVRVLLRGDDPAQEMLRVYVSYQLLTVRIKPLRGELTRIAFWLLMLGVLWWLHFVI
jgi:hypothetical protein